MMVRFGEDGTSNERETRKAEAAACTESAARGPGIFGEHTGEAIADSGGVRQSVGATEARRDRRHDCVVRLGADSFAGRRAGPAASPEKSESGQERESEREPPRGGAFGEERSGNV